jgi:hypothetical protein
MMTVKLVEGVRFVMQCNSTVRVPHNQIHNEHSWDIATIIMFATTHLELPPRMLAPQMQQRRGGRVDVGRVARCAVPVVVQHRKHVVGHLQAGRRLGYSR